ncbi:E3 ubiquitin-protein ligase TRIM58 isoform X2 [Sus scrofa]|uniref:E3 ubiquitin-protein ligase TRIM58 isoform X2 n=1 Tax=Sus scrofa TaxID=9823 RepID=UPI000A2B17B2|nr:E3 ubiquitin-protein ligase TRIM58 isoform X2 [Sus scrofa]
MASGAPGERLCEEARCPVCLDFLQNPVSVDCGHSFCLKCISEFCEKSDSAQSGLYACPQCRGPFRQENFRPNRQLASLVESVRQLGLGAGPSSSRLCVKHHEELTRFCKEDQEALCWVCDTTPEHRSHHTEPLQEAARCYQVKLQMAQELVRNEMEEASTQEANIGKKTVIWKERVQPATAAGPTTGHRPLSLPSGERTQPTVTSEGPVTKLRPLPPFPRKHRQPAASATKGPKVVHQPLCPPSRKFIWPATTAEGIPTRNRPLPSSPWEHIQPTATFAEGPGTRHQSLPLSPQKHVRPTTASGLTTGYPSLHLPSQDLRRPATIAEGSMAKSRLLPPSPRKHKWPAPCATKKPMVVHQPLCLPSRELAGPATTGEGPVTRRPPLPPTPPVFAQLTAVAEGPTTGRQPLPPHPWECELLPPLRVPRQAPTSALATTGVHVDHHQYHRGSCE